MKVKVTTKRVFRKLTTVTFYEVVKITDDSVKPHNDKNGERIKFKTRASVERYCQKNNLSYVEMKHIFYR